MSHWNPNVVTVLRLILAIAATPFIQLGGAACYFTGFSFLLLGEFADILDGYLARRYDKITAVGKFLDPLCDCLAHTTVFVLFVALGWMPWYMLAIILAREFLVAAMRVDLAERRKGVLQARRSGKVKSVSQAIAQCVIVFLHALQASGVDLSALLPEYIARSLLFGATAVTTYTLLDYGLAWRRTRNDRTASMAQTAAGVVPA